MGNANKNAEVCSNIIDNDMEELDNDIYSGFGIKKMKAYYLQIKIKNLVNFSYIIPQKKI